MQDRPAHGKGPYNAGKASAPAADTGDEERVVMDVKFMIGLFGASKRSNDHGAHVSLHAVWDDYRAWFGLGAHIPEPAVNNLLRFLFGGCGNAS